MSPRTAFLGKFIGLYYILVSLSMLTHKQATVEMVTALVHNPPVLFVTGLLVVAVGLALILAHNVWSGGALPVIVTLFGWVTLIKGLLFLFLSPETTSVFFLGELHYEQFFYFYVGFSLLLGIYMTYAGSRQQRVQ
jgi:hypothetical protein